MRANDPTVIGGRYRLLARLGAGGMGVVYLGRSPGGRLVAVKCVHWDLATDPQFRQRFALELEAARRVGGFHTAQVVDADPDGDPPWLVTAYIPGPSLEAAVATHGPLPEAVLRVLGAGLAEALEAIHAAGLVHRDLKPSNVLLSDDGPRVIDFGIARALDGVSITRTQTVLGTPGYMAPEQIAGRPVGPACDLFSLGRVLCHAAGSSPYGSGGNPQVLLYRIMHAVPDLTGVPEGLRPVVAACLALRPEDRPTPAELLARLGPPAYEGATGSWLPEGLRVVPPVPEAPLVEPRPSAVPAVPAAPAVPAVQGAPAVPAVQPAPAAPVGQATRTPTVLAGGLSEAGGSAATEPSDRAERRRRRVRLLWVLLPSLCALIAAAVLVPVYLLRERGSSGLDNGGFVVAKDDGVPPDCVNGGATGGTGGTSATAPADSSGKNDVTPDSVPTGTPHAPSPASPGDNDTQTVGRSIVLSWTRSGAATRVFTRLGNGSWQGSGWLTSADCTFKPTQAGLYQWALVGANPSSVVSSGWSAVRYLYVRADGDTVPNPAQAAPAPPEPTAPADQAVVAVGQPVDLSWSTTGTSSSVSVLRPGKLGWETLSWQPGEHVSYTPRMAGTYVWLVYSSGPGYCTGAPLEGACESGASQQRYLVVR
ncbi:protein kinase [Kitasatospora sp. NPDC056446]|uniref:serine/threonine-protein kinase n=1 Tax=Kitasatospora sp. NPDC056446 TaxID=3345819 RepID=UPI00367CA86E